MDWEIKKIVADMFESTLRDFVVQICLTAFFVECRLNCRFFDCLAGTVTLWSPKVKNPLVKMLCHRSGVRSIAIDKTGQ